MWQHIAATVLLILAAFFVIKRFIKSWQAVKQGQSGCMGCDKCDQPQKNIEIKDKRQ